MKRKEILEDLFGYTEATYYRHKKEQRKIIKLIEKYFNDEDLKEFLSTGKISKMEKAEQYGQYNLTDMILSYAIRVLEKFNRPISNYGDPQYSFSEKNHSHIKVNEYNTLLAVVEALNDGTNIKAFIEKTKEYTQVKSDKKVWSVIEIDKELEAFEIKSISENKDKAISKLKFMINNIHKI